jgi:hypothetical protein
VLRIRVALAALALLAGCKHASPPGAIDTVAAAIAGTVLAGTASAISRASGGCYSACPWGTACNEATGLCEHLPCFGSCPPDTLCDKDSDRCVSTLTPDLQIGKSQEGGSDPKDSSGEDTPLPE